MSEQSAVQRPMLKYAQQVCWEYVSPEQALAMRGGDTGLYLRPVLEEQLLRLNPGVVDIGRAEDVMRRLGLLQPTIRGNGDALGWLRGEGSVFVPEENRERNVRLVDYESPEKNRFHVTDEWRQKGPVYANRADVVFLINGIPVATAETKGATKLNGLAEGIEQVRRYHRETPEMFTSSQLFEVTELLNFYYGVTWETSRKNIFNWKDEESGDYEAKIKRFFDRERFLTTLKDYIIFLTRDDELSKVILRQHQTRAVERVIERVADPHKRRGLVWHTQGSGKTLTMITIASRLLRESVGEKPLVLMLVDRNELEQQLFRNIEGYGIGTVRVALGKMDLRSILAEGFRGLVVSMVHKFDDIAADINVREQVIVLVDEAHRTTGGDLGNYLMAALPNATYIGFTGTPIDRLYRGQGTFKVFGADDERGYLDKYSIAESIEDGTTVPLNYALAPSNLLLDRETLEKQFLTLTEAEGLADVDELNAILDTAVELKEAMKAPDRVEKIARHVAQHYRENVEPLGFKAFLVAVDREACALYKRALDQYLPEEYSEVVYSSAQNDAPMLRQYALSVEQEKAVRKAFAKKDTQPKILIVTEKLLTGFDAPVLYCMYLDKPMRDHVLLQAIARVNRPYEDADGLVKPYGFVLDYVGIFERLETALAFDSDVVGSVIQNIDVLKQLFEKKMREEAPAYLPFTKGWDDKSKERAILHFEEKQDRERYYRFFKEIQALYEILSPDAFLRPYIDDYQALTALYELLLRAFRDTVYVDRELTNKTRELLRLRMSSSELELPGTVYELDARALAALKQGAWSDPTKVLNLNKVLQATVDREGARAPFLVGIGERAEILRELYEDRRISTEQALEKFEQLAQEYVEGDERRQELGLDPNQFGIYSVLAPLASDLDPQQAKAIDERFERFPEHTWDQGQKSALRAELFKVLRPMVGREKMIEATNTLLKLQRI